MPEPTGTGQASMDDPANVPDRESDNAPNAGPGDGNESQDSKSVRTLQLGVGALGILLPFALILGNWIFKQFGSKTVVLPTSMSGSYYTSMRNIFVGSLCALGVFLIGYRRNRREDVCGNVAGVSAIAVALFPTMPPLPTTAPAWISIVHHSAAGILIFILGVFCCVFFVDYLDGQGEGGKRLRLKALLAQALTGRVRVKRHLLYLLCGILIFVFGIAALVTGFTGWGSGLKPAPLYICEALSVLAFGIAWLDKALQ